VPSVAPMQPWNRNLEAAWSDRCSRRCTFGHRMCTGSRDTRTLPTLRLLFTTGPTDTSNRSAVHVVGYRGGARGAGRSPPKFMGKRGGRGRRLVTAIANLGGGRRRLFQRRRGRQRQSARRGDTVDVRSGAEDGAAPTAAAKKNVACT